MSKLVFGVGINDGKYATNCDGKPLYEYNLWKNILNRCFNDKTRSKNETYVYCTVSDNFLRYSYFYEWCHKQFGFDKHGWQLDKDILVLGNKDYNENVCVFVPKEINTFFTSSRKTRGEYPVGVSLQTGYTKYMATVCVSGKNKNLGRYNTVEEAFAVYKKHKESLCKELALKWQHEIDPRVYEAMMKWEVDITS